MQKFSKFLFLIILIILLLPVWQCFAEESQDAEYSESSENFILESENDFQVSLPTDESDNSFQGIIPETEVEVISCDIPSLEEPADNPDESFTNQEPSNKDPVSQIIPSESPDPDLSVLTGSSSSSQISESPSSGTSLPEKIYIQDLSVGISPANDKYSYISFYFSDSESSQQYECYITGLKIDASSKLNDSTKPSYEKLCLDIATNYYLGQSFRISDDSAFNTAYSLSITPIDAEKQNAFLKDNREEDMNNDSGLCWASSVADMFVYSGWADKAKSDGTLKCDANEDEVFSYLKSKFYNSGSDTSLGLNYLFSGENTAQLSYDGQMFFDFYPKIAQLRDGSEDSLKSDGLLRDYVYETVSQTKIVNGEGCHDPFDSFASDILELKTGSSIGIGHDCHAETLFGYIIDTLKSGYESVKALFLSDSDNNAYNVETLPQDYIDKADLPNSFTMNTKLDSPDGVDYSEGTIHLSSWVVLKPYSQATEKEDPASATRNSKDTIDISVGCVSVGSGMKTDLQTTAKKGDDIILNALAQNSSYISLDSSKSPHILGRISVFLDGEQIDSIPVDYDVDSYLCNANDKYHFPEIHYTLSSCGVYSFIFYADGIYYNDQKLQEAYVKNNVSPRPCTVTVTENREDNPSNPGPEKSFGENIRYCFISRAGKGPYKFSFSSPFTAFGKLTINGKIIDTDLYSVSLSDEGYFILNLSDSIISSLDNGTHVFCLYSSDNSQQILFYVTISD